jgi:hypothetical protein
MTKERLSTAIDALTQHTGKTHFLQHQSGLWSATYPTISGDGVVTVLCSRTKEGLFDAICHYIQGYHAGRRSV